MASTQNFYKTFEIVRKRIPNLCITKIDADQITLRSDISSYEEALLFTTTYEAVTCTDFKLKVSKKVSKHSRFADKRQWKCSHRLLNSQSSEVPETCPGKIVIIIKKITKNAIAKDAYMRRNPPYRAVIKIDSNHNHLIPIPGPECNTSKLNHLKISSPVKECFYEYFKRGIHGDRAKDFHVQNLQKANFYALNDTSMNPPLLAIDALYLEWKKMMEYNRLQKTRMTQGAKMAVNAQVKQCFFQYFKLGYVGDVAKALHEENLKRANFHALKDLGMNPPLETIEVLYQEWKKTENAGIQKGPKRKKHVLKNESTQANFNSFEGNVVIKSEIEFDKDTNEEFDKVLNEEDDVKMPILNIKQEIEDDSYGLPVIESYGSLANIESPLTSTFPIVTPLSKPLPQPTTENPGNVLKVSSNNTQLVIFSSSPHPYKTIKCLPFLSKYLSSVDHSSNQYNSYLPFTMSPARVTSYRA